MQLQADEDVQMLFVQARSSTEHPLAVDLHKSSISYTDGPRIAARSRAGCRVEL